MAWLEFSGIYYCFVYQGVGYGASAIVIPPYALYKSFEFTYRLAAGNLPSKEDDRRSSGVPTKSSEKASIENQLGLAAARGHFMQVKSLLDKGAPVDGKNTDGWTALMLASGNGRMDVMQLLIERGADINAKETGAEVTSLMLASHQGQIEVVKLLLDKGAHIDAHAKNGETALMGASFEGRAEVVELLLERGADINAVDK